MSLNPKKWIFEVNVDNFLGFYLTGREIEANPNKCEVIIKENTPSTKKEVMKLTEMLIALDRFISMSANMFIIL